jgi:hypothetical protein
MAKTKAEKMVAAMRKEWWVLKSTNWSINELVATGVLHNRELAGWRPPGGDSYPNPQPGEIVVFEDFLKWGFGFLSILSSKGYVCITRLGFAICIPTRSSLFLSLSTFAKRMGESNPISTSFDIFFA